MRRRQEVSLTSPVYPDLSWMDKAACLDEDPELFFPEGNSLPAQMQTEEAKAVCRRCEVTEVCLKWAMGNPQDVGVRGGLSVDERQALRRRNTRAKLAQGEYNIQDAINPVL